MPGSTFCKTNWLQTKLNVTFSSPPIPGNTVAVNTLCVGVSPTDISTVPVPKLEDSLVYLTDAWSSDIWYSPTKNVSRTGQTSYTLITACVVYVALASSTPVNFIVNNYGLTVTLLSIPSIVNVPFNSLAGIVTVEGNT